MQKRSLVYILLALILLLLLTSLLRNDDQQTIHEGEEIQPISEFDNIQFTASDEYFANPYMGAVASAHSETRYEEGQLVFVEVSWQKLEEAKGTYNFDAFETDIKYEYLTIEKNNRLILRFNMDWPDKNLGKDIPDWLYEEMKQEALDKYTQLLEKEENLGKIEAYKEAINVINREEELYQEFIHSGSDKLDIPGVGTYYKYATNTETGEEYYGGFSPNYSSQVLIAAHSQLMKELGERYNDSDKIFLVLMGSLGHWGEMHSTYVRGDEDAGRYPIKMVEDQYLLEYAKNFTDVKVSSRYPRDIDLEYGFGLYHHGLGSEQQTYDWFKDFYENGYEDYLTKEKYPAMPDFWKTAPCGGELIYTGDQRYLQDENIESTLQQVKDIHMSYINLTSKPSSEEEEKNRRRILSIIGYRFELGQVTYQTTGVEGGGLGLATNWINKGIAPFYFDWDIKAVLKDKNGKVVATQVIEDDIRKLQPGLKKSYITVVQLDDDLKVGEYTLWVGVFNPKTNRAEIKLAVAETDENNLYKIGAVKIN